MTTAITRRVATTGASAGSGTSYGNFFWIGWGNAWGNTFRGLNLASDAVAAEPAIDVTQRVSEAPTGSFMTSRISFLLALEGDESGILLLEGDMQDIGTDALKLEGDATAIGGTQTRRVAEAVV